MKTLYGFASNPILNNYEGDKTAAAAEVVLTLREPSYEVNHAAPDAEPVKTMRYETLRFYVSADQCSQLSSGIRELGEFLHTLNQHHGDTIALRGENKVLRDILGECEKHIEEEAETPENTLLLKVIRAARTGKA